MTSRSYTHDIANESDHFKVWVKRHVGYTPTGVVFNSDTHALAVTFSVALSASEISLLDTAVANFSPGDHIDKNLAAARRAVIAVADQFDGNMRAHGWAFTVAAHGLSQSEKDAAAAAGKLVPDDATKTVEYSFFLPFPMNMFIARMSATPAQNGDTVSAVIFPRIVVAQVAAAVSAGDRALPFSTTMAYESFAGLVHEGAPLMVAAGVADASSPAFATQDEIVETLDYVTDFSFVAGAPSTGTVSFHSMATHAAGGGCANSFAPGACIVTERRMVEGNTLLLSSSQQITWGDHKNGASAIPAFTPMAVRYTANDGLEKRVAFRLGYVHG